MMIMIYLGEKNSPTIIGHDLSDDPVRVVGRGGGGQISSTC